MLALPDPAWLVRWWKWSGCTQDRDLPWTCWCSPSTLLTQTLLVESWNVCFRWRSPGHHPHHTPIVVRSSRDNYGQILNSIAGRISAGKEGPNLWRHQHVPRHCRRCTRTRTACFVSQCAEPGSAQVDRNVPNSTPVVSLAQHYWKKPMESELSQTRKEWEAYNPEKTRQTRCFGLALKDAYQMCLAADCPVTWNHLTPPQQSCELPPQPLHNLWAPARAHSAPCTAPACRAQTAGLPVHTATG